MSLDDTATSEVPEDYQGMLDPRVRSDENGNVTSLPGDEAVTFEKGVEQDVAEGQWPLAPPIEQYDYRRQESLSFLVRLLAYMPETSRPNSIETMLEEAEKITTWLKS